MRPIPSRRLLATGVLAILAAACGGDKATGPATFTDPAATQADLQAIDTVFGTPAFQSFTAATNALNPLGVSALRLGPMLRALSPTVPQLLQGGAKLDADRVRMVRSVVSNLGGLSTTAIFPDSVLGVTFVYDTASDQYVESSRTGAPANGVRFILYGDSIYYNYPDAAVVEVGALDLIDLSTASTAKLKIVVAGVGGTPTYLDETISYSESATSASLSVSGYVTNGQSGANLRRLDFTVSVTAHSSATAGDATISVSYKLNVPAVTVSFTLTVKYDDNAGTYSLSLDLRFSRENESARITDLYSEGGTGSTETIKAYVNGHLYATGTATNGGDPTWTDASGEPLTVDNLATLTAIFEATIGAFTSIDDVLGPAETLFGFTIGF